MSAWLIGHRYALADTLSRLGRQPLSAFLNILVIGVALSLPLMGMTLLRNLQPVTGHLASEPEMSVFMKLTASRSDPDALGTKLRGLPGVLTARFVAKEDALIDLKERPGMADAIAVLNRNPLPDAWILRLSLPAGEGDPSGTSQARLASQIASMDGVDHVQIDSAWVERMDALIRFLRLALEILALALSLAVIGVIFNTIRLQVLTQRDEIEVSRLIGATDRFIRRPFYYTGALEGLAGGVLALALVLGSLVPLNRALLAFVRLYASDFHFAPLNLVDTLAFLALAAALGWFGAIISVRRHLRELIR